MKYRKRLIKYNSYFKKAVFHSPENIKAVFYSRENISYISMGETGCPLLSWFRFSNSYNVLIRGQKHKVWVFIFKIRLQEKFGNRLVRIC